MNHAPAASAVPPVRQLSMRSRLAFGVGSVAYGIKDNGFATFLLLFYNQVIGLSATAVGAAILAALLIEAFVDPLVGFLSDHTRSRWGRRHPWMYGSVIPMVIGWLLLWNPPDWGTMGTLAYLFVAALLVRIALSAFEIPATALAPELTSDYDERTRLFSYRYLFGWAGGLGMLSLSYAVFLAPDAAHPVGLHNPAGYSSMALFGAMAMAVTIIVSSLGLQREIPYLPTATASDETLREHLGTVRRTVSNKAYAVLMLSSLFAYTAQGVSFALSNYIYQYVWRFQPADYQWLALSLLGGATIAFVAAPRLSAGGDKARIATVLAFCNGALLAAPYLARQLGFYPPVGSPIAIPLLLFIFMIQSACSISVYILGSAMLSDVVEEAELRTGQRSEGIFFSGSFFIQKTTTGIGTFVAGSLLTLVAFPVAANPELVPPEVIDRLVIAFMIIMFSFYALAGFTLTRFPFGRAEHLARLEALGARRGSV